MFDVLIASEQRPGRRGLGPSAATALVGHMALGAAAVWATLRPTLPAPAQGPTVVITWPEEPGPSAPDHPPAVGEVAALDWVVPADGRPGLPSLESGPPFDARAWLRGADAAGASPWAPVADPADRGPWSAALVEQPPVVLAGPLPRYPELLRRSRIAGRVVVQAVIDTLGRAEPATVAVVRSPHPGFDEPARNYVRHALFRPGRVHGRAVRVVVSLPIDFQLSP